jgi:hypothetical protein
VADEFRLITRCAELNLFKSVRRLRTVRNEPAPLALTARSTLEGCLRQFTQEYSRGQFRLHPELSALGIKIVCDLHHPMVHLVGSGILPTVAGDRQGLAQCRVPPILLHRHSAKVRRSIRIFKRKYDVRVLRMVQSYVARCEQAGTSRSTCSNMYSGRHGKIGLFHNARAQPLFSRHWWKGLVAALYANTPRS